LLVTFDDAEPSAGTAEDTVH